MVGARELTSGEAPPLQTLVEQLSLRARVVKPRLYVISGRLPAGALGRPQPGELVDRGQHGPARIARRRPSSRGSSRTRSRTSATATCSSRRRWSCSPARSSSSRGSAAGSSRALLYVLGPVAASFTHLLLSPRREFEADRLAAELCESPHGLADALVRPRPGERARRVHGEPGDGAAVHDQPLRRGGPREAVRDASAGRASASSGCATSTRAGARSCARPRPI